MQSSILIVYGYRNTPFACSFTVLYSLHRVARAVLTVNVENLNDNTPVFTDNGAVVIEVNVAVQEEMPVGSLVFALEVSQSR